MMPWALAMLAAAAQATGAAPLDRMAMPAAQSAAPCPATPAPLPAAYAGWTSAMPIASGADAAAAGALTLGRGARVTLGDAAAAHWALPPGRASAAGTRGGIVALTVATPGRYRIALGAGVWIDVVRDGAEVRSAAHAPGPACTPIRKTVDFDLTPGRYVIQLSGNAATTIDVMALAVAE